MNPKGMTLFETLLSVSVLAIVVVAVTPHFMASYNVWELNDTRSIAVQNARVGLDKMNREITQAQEITDITDGIEIIDKLGITVKFLRYFDSERNDYYLGYQPATEPAPIALAGPVGILQFIFYQEDGVTEATCPEDVRSIEIALTVDNGGTLGSYTLSSIAYREIGTGIATDLGFDLEHAVLVLGNMTEELLFTGSPSIEGSHGNVHSNNNIKIKSSISVEHDVSACGYISIEASPTIGGTVTQGAEPVVLSPSIVDLVSFLKPYAYYQLCDDGKVRDQNNIIIDGDGEFNGWSWQGGYWKMNDSDKFDGIYYVETKAKISGSPGSVEAPWTVTIISKESIDMSGSPKIQPALTCFSLVAGTDIEMSGSPEIINCGLVLAREQFDISGSPNIEGAIIAGDAGTSCSLATENEISGSPTIVFNGLTTDLIPGEMVITGWH